VDQPPDVNSDEARARISGANPEAACICAFGALIRDPLLSEHPWLNVHPSLLPRWRGAAPVERAIEAGDAGTGVSIMRPTAELDAGPFCLQEAMAITPEDDYGSLSRRLAWLGGELLVRALDERPEFHEQGEDGVTYAEKIGPEDRILDPGMGPEALERRVRALTPHIGAFTEMGKDRLVVVRARVSDLPAPAPGTLAAVDGALVLGCAGGALELLEVRPAGAKTMDAGAFLRGQGRALSGNP
jgi:methionyl-tRNA formyltransferase